MFPIWRVRVQVLRETYSEILTLECRVFIGGGFQEQLLWGMKAAGLSREKGELQQRYRRGSEIWQWGRRFRVVPVWGKWIRILCSCITSRKGMTWESQLFSAKNIFQQGLCWEPPGLNFFRGCGNLMQLLQVIWVGYHNIYNTKFTIQGCNNFAYKMCQLYPSQSIN